MHHQEPGEKEKRDREEGEAVDPGDRALSHDDQRGQIGYEDVEDGGKAECHGDRGIDQHQDYEAQKQDRERERHSDSSRRSSRAPVASLSATTMAESEQQTGRAR